MRAGIRVRFSVRMKRVTITFNSTSPKLQETDDWETVYLWRGINAREIDVSLYNYPLQTTYRLESSSHWCVKTCLRIKGVGKGQRIAPLINPPYHKAPQLHQTLLFTFVFSDLCSLKWPGAWGLVTINSLESYSKGSKKATVAINPRFLIRFLKRF